MARLQPAALKSRAVRFETVEERLVMSAQPFPDLIQQIDFLAQAMEEAQSIESEVGDLAPLAPELVPMANALHNATGVNSVRANYGFSGAGQTVVVIDSGIAYDHVNLGGGFGAGYRVVGGWDFAENDANPYDDAPAGFHGTHVAGIIGNDNATRMGVAPDVDLVALRVFNDSGQGNFAWVESALQWVVSHLDSFENPITTVNMSLGVPSMNSSSPPNWAMLEDELQALNSAGVFVAVSAGNDFAEFQAQGLSYPAVSPSVVPVASANASGTAMSSFSQRDDRVLVAPGESIVSTVPDALFSFDGKPNDWAYASGTSMASPYVAGASVLVREAFQFMGQANVDQTQIYDVLFDTGRDIYDPITAASYRFIDVDAAIAAIIPDALGDTAATAMGLGVVGDGYAFSEQIGKLGDVDYFTFTAAQSGTVTFSATTTDDLALQWQQVGGVSGTGGQFSFDVVAGQSYTIGLTGNGASGRYDVTVSLQVANEEANSDTDKSFTGSAMQQALRLDQQLKLKFSGSYYENWAGWGEKWVRAESGAWHFITPDGGVYQWSGVKDLAQCNQVASLDSSFHADPTKLFQATDPGNATATTAYQLDQTNDLHSNGNYSTNWGGWQEKWIRSGANQWVFVTPDGGVYRWAGGKDLSKSERIATLDKSYYENPSQLFDAANPTERIDELARTMDQEMGISTTGNYSLNWGGMSEKWLKCANNQWVFITPDGSVYKWAGSVNLATSMVTAKFDATYYADPSKLYSAAETALNASVNSWNSSAVAADGDMGAASATWQALWLGESHVAVVAASSLNLRTNIVPEVTFDTSASTNVFRNSVAAPTAEARVVGAAARHDAAWLGSGRRPEAAIYTRNDLDLFSTFESEFELAHAAIGDRELAAIDALFSE
ncbi:MAG: S8 family serine peptidase [Planctomycetales bacterium]|nr:S8 family serine peptidase [Planctomycetales bacterium]